MSQKPLCECNQGRLPCTCNPQRLVAQLQQDQNGAAQRIAVLENAYIRAGEREHELRKQLAERAALLRECFTAMLKGGYSKPLRERIKAALSASAEPARIVTDRPCRLKGANGRLDLHPAGDRCMWCEGEGFEVEYVQRGSAETVERDERAEFDLEHERLWPFPSQYGPATQSDHRQRKALRFEGWQARAALERKP